MILWNPNNVISVTSIVLKVRFEPAPRHILQNLLASKRLSAGADARVCTDARVGTAKSKAKKRLPFIIERPPFLKRVYFLEKRNYSTS
jgi:hypothetical protein